jgi:hypothetical protein
LISVCGSGNFSLRGGPLSIPLQSKTSVIEKTAIKQIGNGNMTCFLWGLLRNQNTALGNNWYTIYWTLLTAWVSYFVPVTEWTLLCNCCHIYLMIAVQTGAIVVCFCHNQYGQLLFRSIFRHIHKIVKNLYLLLVCPHETTRLPPDGFSWNLILVIFRKTVQKIHVSLKSDKNNRYFIWRPIHIFDRILRISSKN